MTMAKPKRLTPKQMQAACDRFNARHAMPLTAEKIAELRAAAMRATPGPWEAQGIATDGEEKGASFIVGGNLGGLVGAANAWPTEIDSGDFSRVEANATHIANCSPSTVLALLDEIEALRVALEPFARNACEGDGTGDFDVPDGHAARFHDVNDQTKPTLFEGDFRAARRARSPEGTK